MDAARPKIYERNPDTGVIRWRYLGESMSQYGWPHYGNILDQEHKTVQNHEDKEQCAPLQ